MLFINTWCFYSNEKAVLKLLQINARTRNPFNLLSASTIAAGCNPSDFRMVKTAGYKQPD